MDVKTGEPWHLIKGSLLVFLILGILGVAFFFWKYDDVFPAASLNLKLGKAEIVQRSREVSEALGYKTKDCVVASTFGERSDTATFLEHEYSMREANALMHSEINVFYWYTRFCREQEEEEFQVWLSPEGELVGVNHDLEKERPLPSLSENEAMYKALRFVKDKAGVNLFVEGNSEAPQLVDGIKLIRHGSTKQSHRTDYYFTWEDERKDYKGGHQRISAGVSGNLLTSFDRELHVPESFDRKFNDMRSYNSLFKSISYVLFAVVGVGMLFAFVWALSARKIRWRLAAVAGITCMLIEFLDYWNNYQSILQSYDTTGSLSGFLTAKLLSSILRSALSGLAAGILVGGIEAVYRKNFPLQIAAEHFLNWKVLNNKKILETLIAGICIFGVHLGYVAAFYLGGKNLGVWSPLEVRDVSTLSSISPAFSAFAVGVNASVSEELLYRVLCFVFAQKIFKNFWIANFIQAAGWAFMHSDYPQEPAYARGIELTIVGLFYGWVMRRFGVLAGIISHFIYDAFLGVTPLLLSQSGFLAATAIAACSPPFLVLGVGLWRNAVAGQDRMDDEKLSNAELGADEKHEEAPPVEEDEEKPLSWHRLEGRTRAIMLLVCVVAGLICFFVHPRKIGSWARMTVPQSEIIEISKKFLKERGVTEGDWKVSAVLNVNIDEDEVQYGYEKEGFKKTEQIMKAARIPMLWWVRFYKPHQRREYDVAVSSEGRPVAMQVVEEEDASGKDLSQEEARRLTEEFLKNYRPEFLPCEFDTALEQKRKNRTDYSVSYVVPQFKLGDARLKLSVDTVGELVSFPHVSWDIPDAWRFERNKQSLKDHLATGASQLLVVVLAGFVIYWAVTLFRSASIHWRAAVLSGLVIALVTLVNQINEFLFNLVGYDTDIPFESFLAQLAVKGVVAAILYAAIFSILFAIGHAAFRLIAPGVSIASLWHSLVRPDAERAQESRALWRDGALAAYTWVLAFNAVTVITAYLQGRFSPDILVQPLQSVVSTTRYSSPALEEILSALTIGFASMCLAPALRGLYLKYFRSFTSYLLVLLFVLLVLEAGTKHWQDYLIEVGAGAVDIVGIFCWMRYCAGNNPLAYFLVGAINSLVISTFQMYKFAGAVYPVDVSIMTVVLTLPLIVPLLIKAKKSSEKVED